MAPVDIRVHRCGGPWKLAPVDVTACRCGRARDLGPSRCQGVQMLRHLDVGVPVDVRVHRCWGMQMSVFTWSGEGPPLEPDLLVHNSLWSFGFHNFTANCIRTAPLLSNPSLHLGLNHSTGSLISSPAHCDPCLSHTPCLCHQQPLPQRKDTVFSTSPTCPHYPTMLATAQHTSLPQRPIYGS